MSQKEELSICIKKHWRGCVIRGPMAVDHLRWKMCNRYLAFANRHCLCSIITQIKEMEAKMLLDAAKSESRPTWSDDGYV